MRIGVSESSARLRLCSAIFTRNAGALPLISLWIWFGHTVYARLVLTQRMHYEQDGHTRRPLVCYVVLRAPCRMSGTDVGTCYARDMPSPVLTQRCVVRVPYEMSGTDRGLGVVPACATVYISGGAAVKNLHWLFLLFPVRPTPQQAPRYCARAFRI